MLLSCATLLLASRPFLALLPVWVFFIDHVDTAFPADNLVSLCRISFDRCANFHSNSFFIRKDTFISIFRIIHKLTQESVFGCAGIPTYSLRAKGPPS
jgi:hypothetical protein